MITLRGCHQQTIIMTCSQSVGCSDADKCFRSADEMTRGGIFWSLSQGAYLHVYMGGGVENLIKGFSIIFAIVLSLCLSFEFGSGLKSFILPHGSRWGGLQHRQNKRRADKRRHKEACQLKPSRPHITRMGAARQRVDPPRC